MEFLNLEFMPAEIEKWLADYSSKEVTLLTALQNLFELETVPRAERASRARLKLSGIPEKKLLEDFDISWPSSGMNSKLLAELSSLAFIERRENIVFMGPSGIGKTHLILALGYKACMNGYSAYYLSSMDAVEVLAKAQAQNKLKKKLRWMEKPGVLLIDEIGYEHLTKTQSTLLFQLINSRYEKGSIILTTNKTFTEWEEIMGNKAIAAATLDRLLHHAQVVNLKGKSYRMKNRMTLDKTGL